MMDLARIIIILVMCGFSQSLYSQSGYLKASLGGKISHTTHFQLLYGNYKANFGLDYASSLIVGKKYKNQNRLEVQISHESISLIYDIEAPNVKESNRLRKSYAILDISLSYQFAILQKKRTTLGNYCSIGVTNIYHQNYRDATFNGTFQGTVDYDFPQRTVPYTIDYYEHFYSIEGQDVLAFNLKSGIWINYQLNNRWAFNTSLGLTLGLSPIMSRVLDGTVLIDDDTNGVSLFNLNEAFVSTKGDHIALHIGVLYYFKEQKLGKKKR